MLLFHNEVKTNQQHQQMKRVLIGKATKSKCMLQSLLKLWGMPGTKTTRKHVHSEMTVILCTHLRQVSTPFFCNLLVLLPAALEVLIYEVTLFLHQYDSTIISFCIRIEYSALVTQKHGLD